MMKSILISLLAGTLGGAAMQQYGDMPHLWAQSARLYHAANVGDADYLAEVLGCVLEEPILGGKSFQCGERFVWVGPAGSTRLVLGSISNIQAEGAVDEARAFAAAVGTRGEGHIDKGLLFEGQCYGDVAMCTILRGQGWEFRTAMDGRLELVGPDGQLRDVWR